jgi:hypothetical protein
MGPHVRTYHFVLFLGRRIELVLLLHVVELPELERGVEGHGDEQRHERVVQALPGCFRSVFCSRGRAGKQLWPLPLLFVMLNEILFLQSLTTQHTGDPHLHSLFFWSFICRSALRLLLCLHLALGIK